MQSWYLGNFNTLGISVPLKVYFGTRLTLVNIFPISAFYKRQSYLSGDYIYISYIIYIVYIVLYICSVYIISILCITVLFLNNECVHNINERTRLKKILFDVETQCRLHIFCHRKVYFFEWRSICLQKRVVQDFFLFSKVHIANELQTLSSESQKYR